MAAHRHKATAHIADANTVVMAEVGNGFEVRCQTSGEPHQLHVALSFALQAPAGLNAIEVAIDVELEKYRGVVAGTSCHGGSNALEPKARQIQFVDKHVNDAYWVVFVDVVIQALGQQCDLAAVTALDVSRHLLPPSIP